MSSSKRAQDSTLSHLPTREETLSRAVETSLVLVLQSDRPLAFAARFHLSGTSRLAIGRGPETGGIQIEEAPGGAFAIRVPDPWMSSAHGVISASAGGWMVEDMKSKNGTLVNSQPIERALLSNGDVIELGHTFFVFRQAVSSSVGSKFVEVSGLRPLASGFATLSASFAQELARVEAVAPSPVSVIIQGESGTGKELIASAVHKLSGRSGAFVAVNCAALPKTLVESELFGYRKGAFSGANEDRPGLIRSADHGTLFLDEVADLDAAAQGVLLRALQESEVLPVGATRPVRVDFRLISATHRDIAALVAQDRFRVDLLARISGLTVALPPLRERIEDLGLLIGAILRRHYSEEAGRISFTSDAARALLLYSWPLNIRELEKNVTAAVALARGAPIQLSHLSKVVREALESKPVSETSSAPAPADSVQQPRLSAPDRRRREQILALLREHGGNITAVARALGTARTQVQRWLKRYRIDSKSYRQ
jgi:sigma-54 dependent transcriptional regulator, acetoin dehydrogenase operon transcriptional activator AcoR